jgi:hypothetical protein
MLQTQAPWIITTVMNITGGTLSSNSLPPRSSMRVSGYICQCGRFTEPVILVLPEWNQSILRTSPIPIPQFPKNPSQKSKIWTRLSNLYIAEFSPPILKVASSMIMSGVKRRIDLTRRAGVKFP